MRAAWDAGFIDCIVRQTGSGSGIKRNQCFGEVTILAKGISSQKCLVGFDGIEGGITEEHFWLNQRVFCKEPLQCRQQKSIVAGGFIFIGRAGFLLSGDLRMSFEEGFVVEVDCSGDTKTVGNDARLVGIAEVAVDILLFHLGLQ